MESAVANPSMQHGPPPSVEAPRLVKPRRLQIWSQMDMPRCRVRSTLRAPLLRVDAGGEGETPLILHRLVEDVVLGESLGIMGE